MKNRSPLPPIGLSILLILLTAFLLYQNPFGPSTPQLRVAVAANFAVPMRTVIEEYEKQNNIKIDLIIGSTGNLYSQITNGAPFDVFFAADAERPELLENEGLMIPNSRFTYAQGKILLWSGDDELSEDFPSLDEILASNSVRRLAIANPELAPYGRAAQQTLEGLGLWESLQPKLVRGESISQTYQFVKSGNAELGFIALSQEARPGGEISGSHWLVPDDLYDLIDQQAVILSHSENQERAWHLAEFVQSEDIQSLIRQFGYVLPSEYN